MCGPQVWTCGLDVGSAAWYEENSLQQMTISEVSLSYSPWAHTKLNSHKTPTLWQRHILTTRPFSLRDTTHTRTHTQTEAHAQTDTHTPMARETLPTHWQMQAESLVSADGWI